MSASESPIGILVVDDSATYRRLVTMVVKGERDMRVVGTAANGREALGAIASLRPDVVLLDVEMPVMDGLATLRAVRSRWPHQHVLMLSSLTSRGAAITLEALSAGAADYIEKPCATGSVTLAREALHCGIVTRVRAICRRLPEPTFAATRAEPARPTARRDAGRIDLVAVGSSTGGPNALATVISSLPASLPVPVVVVQHMPATFTKLLAERLDRSSALPVSEVTEPVALDAAHVYVATGGRHLVLERRGARVVAAQSDAPPENSCRPAVDILFRSAATIYGPNTLAVVLTGMGSDGQLGATAVHERGGTVYAQDEATSVVWGMPGAVVRAGLADRVLALDDIAAAITSRVAPERAALAGGARGAGGER